MASKFALVVAAAAALAGCQHTPYDLPDRGLEAVNVAQISRADYVFDASAPAGLAPGEAARLDAWFRNLGLSYGDAIYVDGGSYPDAARNDVAQVAGTYGLMVTPGAPVTVGAVQPGTVRIVVSRLRAEVPNCPNWSRPAQPNDENRMHSNFGCGVNTNMAAMIANPQDLVHGRDGGAVTDPTTANRGVGLYRSTAPTGSKGLQDVSTSKKGS